MEHDQVMERLTELAHSVAKKLPESKRQEMHEKMLSDELNKFVKKVHFVNALFGGLSESARIGVVVDKLFYEVTMLSKEFESESQANDYAQVRKEQVEQL